MSSGLFKLIRNSLIDSVAMKLYWMLISGQYTKAIRVWNNQQWFYYPNRIGESLSGAVKIPNIYSKPMNRILCKLCGSEHKKKTISNMKLIRYDMIDSVDKKRWKFGWINITVLLYKGFLFFNLISWKVIHIGGGACQAIALLQL